MPVDLEKEKTTEQLANEFVDEVSRDVLRKNRKKIAQKKIAKYLSRAVLEFSMGLSRDTLIDGRLYPYQEPFGLRIIYSVIMNDGDTVTALFSRQSGKTMAVSVVCAGLAVLMPKLAMIPELVSIFPALKEFRRGIWIGIFAPIMDQARKMYNQIRGNFSSPSAEGILADPEIQDQLTTNNGAVLALSSGSFIECISASPTSNIESKTFHVMVVDEAQDVETNKLRKSISPMGAATNATMVMSGTPNTYHSAFYEQTIQNKSHDKQKDADTQDHYEYDYTIVQQYNERYAKYIQKEKARYGEDSDEFRMSYKLEWIFERGMFTTVEILKTRVYHPRLERDSWDKFRGWSPIAAIDYGKSQDSTVCTVGVVNWKEPIREPISKYEHYKHVILDWMEISGDDWNSQFYQIVDYLGQIDLQKIVCDATGVGSGITDRIRAHFSNAEVEDFVYSGPQKSDGYKHFSIQIRKGLIWVPAGPVSRNSPEFRRFNDEILALEKEYRGQILMCHKPANIRNAHDDYPDSAMMFSWAAREPVLEPFDAVEGNIFGFQAESNYILTGR